MRYPRFWKSIVNALALAAGVLTLVIAVMSVVEAIMRYVFHSPTSWSLTTCTYILLYVVFFRITLRFPGGRPRGCGHGQNGL